MAPELVLLVLALFFNTMDAVRAELRPSNFVFGDSLVDPGNNDYIETIAKSNFAPNGEDFPSGATGRFCNGRTVADVIAQKLNVPFVPAYLAPSTKGSAILQGVNYASAAAGILDSTGANYIGRISLNRQIAAFQNTQLQFRMMMNSSAAAQLFRRALYYITIGSNDYINNYLLPDAPTQYYTPRQYEDHLISEFSQQLRLLYNLGARRFLVSNVGPLGCIPSQLAVNNSPDGNCIDFINGYVQSFNQAVGLLLDRLTTQLTGFTYVYGNAYDLVIDKINNPANFGFSNKNTGCCGLGAYNGEVPCIPGIEACQERDQYIFWDPFHPTDAVNEQLAEAFFSGPTSAISPMNIQQLASMDYD